MPSHHVTTWTGLDCGEWTVHTQPHQCTLHTHTLTMESFLTAEDVYSATGVSYDAHAALDGALRYAAVDSNIGAELVRKLVKTNAITGNVACELSARTHGPAEWWVIVEKEVAAATSIAPGQAKGTGKGKAK